MTFSGRMLDELERRRLDVEVMQKLGIDSVTRSGSEYLIFPCLRSGRIHRRKFRTLGEEKKFMQEGDGPIPWNEDCLRDQSLNAETLFIFEGEIDALSAIQCGFKRSISVPDGAPAESTDDPFNSKRYEWVKEMRPLISGAQVPQIVLATDGDAPGLALRHDLANLLGRPRCCFVTYPMGKHDKTRRLKDLNEVLADWGQKGVTETLRKAERQFLQKDGVYRLSDLPDAPESRCYAAGFALFDDHYKLRPGDFCVVTGIPSHGKTSFVADYVCRQIDRHGFNVAWASFEQDPVLDHKRNLLTWKTQTPYWRLSEDEREEALKWIEAHHRFIVAPEETDVGLDWLVEVMTQAVVQHDCQIIVVDPWNEMDHQRDSSETVTEYVGRAIRTIKRFARSYRVHVIVVAHPTKIRPDEEGGFRMPTLYDISDSANWYNKADVGVVVHRANGDDTIVRVAKSRYHSQIGKPGAVVMQFCKDDLRYREIEKVPELCAR